VGQNKPPKWTTSECQNQQIDVGKKQFDKFLMKSMIRQSGFTAQEFCSGSISLSRLQTIKAAASPEKSN
jgi:hypothetical protein